MAPSLSTFHADVARYLAAQTGQPETAFQLDTSLIAGRLIDSLTFIQLLDFLERSGARIPELSFDLSELDSIRALYRQVY